MVNGSIGSAVTVHDGGRLAGNGKVGATVIASGGVVAPGSSIGTLVVAGDISFAAGSGYEVEINPALEGDLIQATGLARISGGTVQALKAAGVYTPGSRWTIVAAAGGVAGTFDALTQNMPFVDLTLAYDPTHVFIDATRNDVPFCDLAMTPNQCAAAQGADSTGVGNAVHDAVAALPDAASARAAFDLLSGEMHASAKSVLIDSSRFLRDAATARMRGAFGDATAGSLPVMAYGGGGAELATGDTDRPAAWGQAIGTWGDVDNDGNAAQVDRSTGGFLVGVDVPVAESGRIGMVTGYSHTHFDVRDRASSGDSDNFHLGAYGGARWGGFGLSAGAAYTWHDIETERTVMFPGFANTLGAGYDAATAQVFGEVGYRIDRGGLAFEPFANLAYVPFDSDAFTETGGSAALYSANARTDVTYTTVGLRASTDFALRDTTATLSGMLGWRHASGDVTPFSTFAFAGGDAFAIAGTPIAEDALVLAAGLAVEISANATLGVSYSGQLASGAQDHELKVDFRVAF